MPYHEPLSMPRLRRKRIKHTALTKVRGCGDCLDLVNGAKVSKVQRQLCEQLGGELNRPEGRLNIDIGLEIEGQKIAIEYDGWY